MDFMAADSSRFSDEDIQQMIGITEPYSSHGSAEATSGYIQETGPVFDFNKPKPCEEYGSPVVLLRHYRFPLVASDDQESFERYFNMLRILPTYVSYFGGTYRIDRAFKIHDSFSFSSMDTATQEITALLGNDNLDRTARGVITGVIFIYKNEDRCRELGYDELRYMRAVYSICDVFASNHPRVGQSRTSIFSAGIDINHLTDEDIREKLEKYNNTKLPLEGII